MRSWLCELAARAFEQEGNDLERARRGYIEDSGEGRWTIEDAIEQRRPDAGDHRLAVRALLLARQRRLRGEGARGPAQPVRRPRGAGRPERRDATIPTAPPEAAENPLVEGLERLPVHPTTLVIFGATGDLAKRKLLPALYNLAHEGALPERFNLIGVVAQRHVRRRVPRSRPRRRSASSRAASPTSGARRAAGRRPLRARARSTTTTSTTRLDAGARRVRRGGRPAAEPRASTCRRRRRSSR